MRAERDALRRTGPDVSEENLAPLRKAVCLLPCQKWGWATWRRDRSAHRSRRPVDFQPNASWRFVSTIGGNPQMENARGAQRSPLRK